MRLKLNTKNPRIVMDEMGDEIFRFTGLHLEDLREILAKVNQYSYREIIEAQECPKGYYKSRAEI